MGLCSPLRRQDNIAHCHSHRHYQRGGGYCGWENGNFLNGEVWFYVYLYDKEGNYLGCGYDDVLWALTIDEIVGDYTEVTSCFDYSINDYVYDQESDVKIEKIDDTTISIYNFYGWEDNFTAKVDIEARTVTVDIKTDWAGYYSFCKFDEPDTPVVGTINDDGTISFSNWTAYYQPYNYSYIYNGATSVLTKKKRYCL